VLAVTAANTLYLRALAVLVLTCAGLQGCAQQCDAPRTTGSQLTGMVHYTTGDGASAQSAVDSGEIFPGTDDDSVALSGSFTDSLGQARAFTIDIGGLSADTSIDLAQESNVCFSLETDAMPTCAPLAGTIDVQAMSSTCIADYGCSVNIEATLTATATVEGTSFAITGALDTTTNAVPSMCSSGG
jgi:hypothetical protein